MQSQNTQSQNMQTLPLTEKDLAYMQDQIHWELVATKKAYQYAHQTLEPDCRQLMLQVAEQHQRNVERVMGHLSEHLNQTVQAHTPGAQPVTTHM